MFIKKIKKFYKSFFGACVVVDADTVLVGGCGGGSVDVVVDVVAGGSK